ncbi:casein kinase I isoform X1 [Drosophila subpulchrella]|uniref:casein kinase I isoform X1 n=1 Tax=Drosophila subpulchrella TaxID=1486046 RepID=UPI0018A1592B|nr:casein kinase I isoform X1 [Drosophila subpulchrella]
MAEPERRRGKDERRWQSSPDANPPQTQIRTEQPHPPPPYKPQRNHDNVQRSQRSSEGEQAMPEIIVAGKYRLLSRIGNGSFGELYRAEGLKYGEKVAIKLESASVNYPLLPREAKIYEVLRGGEGIPHVRHFCTEGVYNVMVMDLLGPTLEDLLNLCARSFSMKTTLMLADQILARVELLHRKCFIHRDIKPDNFLMGLGRHCTQVFMIDFGLAKKFYSLRSQKHIGYSEKKDLVGTARYASVRAHYAEQGRRDDLESVGYLLLYFQRGRLPWQGIRAQSQVQKYERIAECKAKMSLQALCAGLPTEFYVYLKYCRKLHFAENPDYFYLRQLFVVLFKNQTLLNDSLYDWLLLQQETQTPQEKQGGKKVRERVRDKERGGIERNPNRDRQHLRDSARNRDTNRDRGLEPIENTTRDGERNGVRGKGCNQEDRSPKKDRQACCSYHLRKKRVRDRDRDRRLEQQTERRIHPEPQEPQRMQPCL